MMLGIPYHVALAYRPGRAWMVPVDESDPLMTDIAHMIHIFRMPTFFLIAGYFCALLLEHKNTRDWLSGRIARIGVPLAVSLVTIVPILNMIAASVRVNNLGGLHYLYPTSGTILRHLWFLVVLLYLQIITAFFCAMHPAVRLISMPQRWNEFIAQRFTIFFIISGITVAGYDGAVVGLARTAMREIDIAQGLFRMADLIAALPFYVIGLFLRRASAVRAAFDRPNITIVILTLVATGIALRADHDQAWRLERTFGGFAALGWAQSLISLGRSFFDRESATIRMVVESSFAVYIFHLPLAIFLTIVGYRLEWGVWVEWALISAATFFAAFSIWLVIRQLPMLNYLYTGVTTSSRQAKFSPPRE